MGRHGVDLLRFNVKLDRITMLGFAAGAELFVFMWLQCSVLF